MDTKLSAMPEMDWLTGLSSRAAFGRQVSQADRDRDRFAIAVIEIEDFGEINRQLDYETGDELLRVVGQALAFQTSVDTFAARLGGAQFAVLTVQRMAGDLRSWIAPIAAAVKAAVGTWTFDLIDFAGECPVEPELRIGAAYGFTSRVWSDAAEALELAKTDPQCGAVVLHDADDPRFVARARRRILADRITAALDEGSLRADGRAIDIVGGRDPDWRWLRLGILQPAATSGNAEGRERGENDHRFRFRRSTSLVDCSMVPPTVERRLESWLVEQAGHMLSAADDQLRVTVPVAREMAAGTAFAQRLLALLERFTIPPSRMVFEVDEAALIEAGPTGRDFTRQLERIGSGVVIANSVGGWQAWRATEDLPILYVKPDSELVERAANTDLAANRILSALIDVATGADRELIAPPSNTPDAYLSDMGFTYRERVEAER